MSVIKSFLTLMLSLCMLTVPFADQEQNPVCDPEAEYHMSLNTSKFETHAVNPSPFTKAFLTIQEKPQIFLSLTHVSTLISFLDSRFNQMN